MSLEEERLKELGLWPVWQRKQRPEPAAEDSLAAPVPPPAAAPLVEMVRVEAEAPPVEPEAVPAPAPRGVPAPADRRARIMGLSWDELREDVLSCTACPLHETRTQGVFGVGDPRADWLFVGEAPGAEEDARGEPFVGQAGRLLDNMLAALGLRRGRNVYIANVLKSRPPQNRNPQPEEIEACEPYLRRQIELIQPRIIVTLGKFAAQTLLQSDAPIGALRGHVHRYQGVPLVATYHPAYLLRTLPDKAKAWQDLCLARATLEGLQAASEPL